MITRLGILFFLSKKGKQNKTEKVCSLKASAAADLENITSGRPGMEKFWANDEGLACFKHNS